MTDWKPITATSPTERECKEGIAVGYYDSLGTFWLTNVYDRRNIDTYHTHWVGVEQPPRPDPDKEAMYLAISEMAQRPSIPEKFNRIFEAGWTAALAYARGGKG